jgi:hypothetical protein
MNTSKQVNVIIGLLMVGAIATLLYYLWDVIEREHDAGAEGVLRDDVPRLRGHGRRAGLLLD